MGLPAPRELLVFVAAMATALFQLQHLCPQCGAWQEAQTRGSHCPPSRGQARGGDCLSGYLPRRGPSRAARNWPFFCPPQRDRGATGSLSHPRCQAAAPSPPTPPTPVPAAAEQSPGSAGTRGVGPPLPCRSPHWQGAQALECRGGRWRGAPKRRGLGGVMRTSLPGAASSEV